jgi:C1A family cysteine protease
LKSRNDNKTGSEIFNLDVRFIGYKNSNEDINNIINNMLPLSKKVITVEQKQNNTSLIECNILENNIYPLGYIPPDESEVVEKNLDGGDSLSSWDWRNCNGYDWTTTAKNQGICGSCWSFAANGALEAEINIEKNNPSFDIDLSEQYILSCHPTMDCNGGNAYLAFEYMYNNGGVIPESCFPYQQDDTIPCDNKCTDWNSKLVSIFDYSKSYSSDLDAIKNLIVCGPACLTFIVYEDFFYPSSSWDNNGVYKYDGYSDSIGYHEVTVLGYKDTPSNSRYDGYWICKNSWGQTWGPWNDGFFGIAYGNCEIDNDITWVEYKSDGYKKIGLIDQKQTQIKCTEKLIDKCMWAQSFKPSLNCLKKV